MPFHAVATGKLNRARNLSVFGAAFHTLKGVLRVCAILRCIRPDGVFSSGGFASVPVALAARSLDVGPMSPMPAISALGWPTA